MRLANELPPTIDWLFIFIIRRFLTAKRVYENFDATIQRRRSSHSSLWWVSDTSGKIISTAAGLMSSICACWLSQSPKRWSLVKNFQRITFCPPPGHGDSTPCTEGWRAYIVSVAWNRYGVCRENSGMFVELFTECSARVPDCDKDQRRSWLWIWST